MRKKAGYLAMSALLGLCASSRASVVIDTVTVGNPGNAPDTRYATPGYGGVGYAYSVGKFEITTAQFCDFLNAVAVADPYRIYSTDMNYGSFPFLLGCNIQRSGSPGSYTYTVGNGSPADLSAWGNRPVNDVSWGAAARFANWMHNGQPSGPQGPGMTEDGSYVLNGALTIPEFMAVTRKPNATWVIPSEDEWYKAAYHKNDGVTGHYWDYPTRTNETPNNGNPGGDTGNSANFYDGDYTIGSPYWRTPVGYFTLSDSPYGTFDQGGNLWEWNEASVTSTARGLRGAYFSNPGSFMLASDRNYADPSFQGNGIGFRLALVPEPATIVMLLVASVGIIRRRRA